MVDLGLENELLEFGGPDLVPFLQHAVSEPKEEAHAASSSTYPTPIMGRLGVRDPLSQAKYLDLLAHYYIMKRQHLLVAHVLLRLAESRSMDERDAPSLEQRCQYLNNAVLQAKYATNNDNLVSSTKDAYDDGLLDLLEGKLAVVRFQITIREQLEVMASRLEAQTGTSASGERNMSRSNGKLQRFKRNWILKDVTE